MRMEILISSIDSGEYAEYALKLGGDTITSSDFQLNAFIEMGYWTCKEISGHPIS